MTRSWPTGVWGVVSSGPERRVKIEATRDRDGNETGFLLITEEEAGTFDVWLEHEEDVTAFLATRAVRWS